jgi:hypothetical protein
MTLPFAHIGGVPIEETVGSFGPALLIALAAAAANLRARWLRRRSPAASHRSHGAALQRDEGA